jgi:2-amino-4-hydroxy-6-hydroxymethyldihydropteridine diphosphokinase
VKTVFIALGSNLGERFEHLRVGIKRLERHHDIQVLQRSRVFETEPFGVIDVQNAYLNAAVKIETRLSPHDLLQVMLEIERIQGRERFERWGARTLDLDILLYSNETISEPTLEIPHPRMLERAFVMAPLADIAPNLEIPGTTLTVRQALERVGVAGVWATELEL